MLAAEIATCTDCPLANEWPVPGNGPVPADIMFVAEAPGEAEQYGGRPLIGRSGRRFNAALRKLLGLSRSQVYATNVVKHRPPGNRDPKRPEVLACRKWLEAELAAVQPKIVVTMGRFAMRQFLPKAKLSVAHGRPHPVEANGQRLVVVPWYHPAAGFYSASAYRDFLSDAAEFWKRLKAKAAGLTEYRLVAEDEALIVAMASDVIGFDIETTSDGHGGFGAIVGYSVSSYPLKAVYVPHEPRLLKPVLEDPRVLKVCHNAKFEYRRLAEAGITLRNAADTKGLAYVLGYQPTHLKSLAYDVLGVTATKYSEVAKGHDTSNAAEMQQVFAENFSYGAADADNTRRLYFRLADEAKSQSTPCSLWTVYEALEEPLIPILARMEARGIGIKRARLAKLRDEVAAAEAEALADVQQRLGIANARSTQQKAAALAALGAPIKRRTSRGDLATDAATLKAIRSWRPELIDALLASAKWAKLRGFVDGFTKATDSSGRIHPSYNQFGHWEEASDEAKAAPVTGRLSCSRPNIQNIPHHGHSESDLAWGLRLRSCLAPPQEGWLWLQADFAQEEARIIAAVAEDKRLADDFARGVDVYSLVAKDIYSRDVAKDSFERFVGKTFFLAWCYGAAAAKLMTIDSRLDATMAARAIERLSRRYPGVAVYPQKQAEFAEEFGYVETLYGRRRWLPGIFCSGAVHAQAVRYAVNTPIQGTGADVLKVMLINVDKDLDKAKASLIATVHDELDLQVAPDYVAEAKAIISRHAAKVLPKVELPVEFSLGPSWGELT